MSTPFEDRMNKYRTGGGGEPQGLDTLRGVPIGGFNRQASTPTAPKGDSFVKRMQHNQTGNAELPDARRDWTPNS